MEIEIIAMKFHTNLFPQDNLPSWKSEKYGDRNKTYRLKIGQKVSPAVHDCTKKIECAAWKTSMTRKGAKKSENNHKMALLQPKLAAWKFAATNVAQYHHKIGDFLLLFLATYYNIYINYITDITIGLYYMCF